MKAHVSNLWLEIYGWNAKNVPSAMKTARALEKLGLILLEREYIHTFHYGLMRPWYYSYTPTGDILRRQGAQALLAAIEDSQKTRKERQ